MTNFFIVHPSLGSIDLENPPNTSNSGRFVLKTKRDYCNTIVTMIGIFSTFYLLVVPVLEEIDPSYLVTRGFVLFLGMYIAGAGGMVAYKVSDYTVDSICPSSPKPDIKPV